MEVRLEGSSRTITILMDHDLLVNMEDVVPSLGPLCSNAEGRTLATFNDPALSTGIAGLTLRVSFSIFSFYVLHLFLLSFFILD